MNKIIQENLIRQAMKEAEKGIKESNSPFGAVLTDKHGNIIATAHNTTKTKNDPTGHAEINLLRKAGKKLKSRTLNNCYIFSNAESCPMCMSACIKARVKHYFFGAPFEKNSHPNLTVFDLAKATKKKLIIKTGILKEKCLSQIKRGRKQ